jgi:hypothetical protein
MSDCLGSHLKGFIHEKIFLIALRMNWVFELIAFVTLFVLGIGLSV